MLTCTLSLSPPLSPSYMLIGKNLIICKIQVRNYIDMNQFDGILTSQRRWLTIQIYDNILLSIYSNFAILVYTHCMPLMFLLELLCDYLVSSSSNLNSCPMSSDSSEISIVRNPVILFTLSLITDEFLVNFDSLVVLNLYPFNLSNFFSPMKVTLSMIHF